MKPLYFGPFVAQFQVDESIVKRLRIDGKKTKESHNRKLAGHLNNQFRYPIETANWFYEAVGDLFNAYRIAHCEFHGFPLKQMQFKYQSLWVNYMQAGDFNPPHTHDGDLSFVLFLNVPEKLKEEAAKFEGTASRPGQILFNYGESSRTRQWATVGRAITPSTGMLIIFPAQMQHWVCPFKSRVERVSVSGNLTIEYKESISGGYF